MEFKFEVKEFKNGAIENIGEKIIYNVDDTNTCKDWAKNGYGTAGAVPFVQMTSGVKVKTTGSLRGRLVPGSLGYIVANSNDVGSALTNTFILSSCAAGANGYSILPQNLMGTVTMFSVRKLVKPNWINDKDQFLQPNEEHPDFAEFTYDSLVYSLFNTSSQQASIKTEYDNKKVELKNHFFFLGKDFMKELADEYSNTEVFNGASNAEESFVYQLISAIEESEEVGFSNEAIAILETAKNIFKSSFPLRRKYAEQNPEFQINRWDAGWYQVKEMIKDIGSPDLKKEFNDFQELYRNLGIKMQPKIYELGFLK